MSRDGQAEPHPGALLTQVWLTVLDRTQESQNPGQRELGAMEAGNCDLSLPAPGQWPLIGTLLHAAGRVSCLASDVLQDHCRTQNGVKAMHAVSSAERRSLGTVRPYLPI